MELLARGERGEHGREAARRRSKPARLRQAIHLDPIFRRPWLARIDICTINSAGPKPPAQGRRSGANGRLSRRAWHDGKTPRRGTGAPWINRQGGLQAALGGTTQSCASIQTRPQRSPRAPGDALRFHAAEALPGETRRCHGSSNSSDVFAMGTRRPLVAAWARRRRPLPIAKSAGKPGIVV